MEGEKCGSAGGGTSLTHDNLSDQLLNPLPCLCTDRFFALNLLQHMHLLPSCAPQSLSSCTITWDASLTTAGGQDAEGENAGSRHGDCGDEEPEPAVAASYGDRHSAIDPLDARSSPSRST